MKIYNICYFLQEQILTDEIKELNHKVLLETQLDISILVHYSCLNLGMTSSNLLQGNLMHQENIELYKKVSLVSQENAGLQTKVLADQQTLTDKNNYSCAFCYVSKKIS